MDQPHQPTTAGATDRRAAGARAWSFVADGPPLWLAAGVFVALLAAWTAAGAPTLAAAIVGIGLVGTMALEFPRWAGASYPARGRSAAADGEPLRARLDAARARRIEQDRWR